MAKENISATVEKDVAEYLDMPGRNRSQTINQAVKQYMKADSSENAMLRLRKEQLESDISNLESQLSEKRAELERVDERLDEQQSKVDKVVQEAREAFAGHEMDPSDPAVQNYASKADMTAQELINRVEQ